DIAGPATAIGRTHRFWYRKTTRGAETVMVIDADSRQKQPAFDHDKIARSLSAATGNSYSAGRLPFNAITFADDGLTFTAPVDGTPYRCVIADGVCRRVEDGPRVGAGLGVGRRGRDTSARVSPDGKWEAFVDNFNVAIRPAGTHRTTRLSTDGSEGNYYDAASIVWSPDSKNVAAYRVRPGYRREVHYIASSPEDQLQPKHSTLLYAKPGDALDVDQPVLFRVDPLRELMVDNALFPNAYANSELVWRKDSRAIT